MNKRILACVLSGTMLLSGMIPAFAAEETISGCGVYSNNAASSGTLAETTVQQESASSSGTCGENLIWTLSDSGTLTISGTGEMEAADYGDYGWSGSSDEIKEIVVEPGVTSIAAWAFSSCQNLQSVTLADSVQSIDYEAFSECYSLQTVTLGSGLTTIGDNAFASCTDLERITIPANVTRIDGYALAYCNSLRRIYFCGAVPTLGDNLFESDNATAYYPIDTEGWQAVTENQYGGTIRWRSWDPSRPIVPVETIFSDVSPDAWYYEKVQFVYDNDLMEGNDGRFMPNDTVNRAMVVQILYNNAKACGTVKEGTGQNFKDVSQDDWFYEAVQWASANGITSGTGDGLFEPYKAATREQFAQFLYQDAGAPFVGGTIRFSDAGKVSSWAKSAVLWAIRNGILSGKQNGSSLLLDPLGSATRAEAASMLMGYLEPTGRTALTSSDETYDERMARIFGDGATERKYPSKAEAEKHQTTVSVKVWDINSQGAKYTRTLQFQINTELVDTIEQIFAEIYASDEKFPIYSIGGYAWRGDNSKSEHCLGTAVDINPDENYQCENDGTAIVGSYWKPGEDPYSIPEDGIVVNTFAKYGFTWGGNFNSSKDYMHFSYFGT